MGRGVGAQRGAGFLQQAVRGGSACVPGGQGAQPVGVRAEEQQTAVFQHVPAAGHALARQGDRCSGCGALGERGHPRVPCVRGHGGDDHHFARSIRPIAPGGEHRGTGEALAHRGQCGGQAFEGVQCGQVLQRRAEHASMRPALPGRGGVGQGQHGTGPFGQRPPGVRGGRGGTQTAQQLPGPETGEAQEHQQDHRAAHPTKQGLTGPASRATAGAVCTRPC